MENVFLLYFKVFHLGSVIDGRGPLWWDGQGTWGSKKPKLFKIQVTNAILDGIHIKDCPSLCSIVNGENIVIRNWVIDNLEGDEVYFESLQKISEVNVLCYNY